MKRFLEVTAKQELYSEAHARFEATLRGWGFVSCVDPKLIVLHRRSEIGLWCADLDFDERAVGPTAEKYFAHWARGILLQNQNLKERRDFSGVSNLFRPSEIFADRGQWRDMGRGVGIVKDRVSETAKLLPLPSGAVAEVRRAKLMFSVVPESNFCIPPAGADNIVETVFCKRFYDAKEVKQINRRIVDKIQKEKFRAMQFASMLGMLPK